MKLTIEVKENEYFIKLLSFIQSIPPFSQLTNQELTVLASLLELNYKYRKIPFVDRNKLIFSGISRKWVTKHANIHYNNLYNVFQRLKKKGFIEQHVEEEETIMLLNPKYALGKHQDLIIMFDDNE